MVALATLLLAVTFVIFWSWMLKHSSSCDHCFELFFFWGGMIEIKNQTWTFNAAEMCLCPSPDLCLSINLSQRSTDHSSDFMMWFVLWHVLSTVGSNVDRWVPLEITRDGRWKLDGPELNFECQNWAQMLWMYMLYFLFVDFVRWILNLINFGLRLLTWQHVE